MLPVDWSLVVAGGGPAGYMAAITAAEQGLAGVLLLEATPQPLGKVLISGGGRCNVTHACWDPRALVGHYPRGSRALRGPFSRFAPGDCLAWFADRGLELVEEPDGRLFPRSNRSSSVVAVLEAAAEAAGVIVWRGASLRQVEAREGGGFSLRLRLAPGLAPAATSTLSAARLLLATGGHPSGRQLASQLGHGVVAPVPSLFTLALEANPLAALRGVVMDPVGLELRLPSGRFRERGPLLFTGWGVSGPATLRLTAFAARALKDTGYRADLRIDWSGGSSADALRQRFRLARAEQARRRMLNARPWPELSRRLWIHLLERHGVAADQRWADLRRREEDILLEALRCSAYGVGGRGPFGEEFVTAGGVSLGEVNLATMESRLQPGLYFAGELLDVDGVTGGFNFQHCWTSGWLAGGAIARESHTCDPVGPGSADLVENREHR
ncbi:NAD(P)/FAD-dependent oxidoreductase [Synechococcus sp. BSF8S]|uniref:NAD(P)/FAD-dependent oxidoreductase n=1 Tax=Synechococcales TaxID=1890424 RepID=UPI001627F248|nr:MULTISPECIES: NAD(P)/FAD-dependent oxidoreductase [unclassified Synechococcus]MBC1260375.1 NAD(P)/FAD-dependent oxidoreductase [Synechococcus sp. BSF8S]MBC1263746.1 NAD(P)/FAD-dependent oxidoreductase [Synechococcus sp. BSA11S]